MGDDSFNVGAYHLYILLSNVTQKTRSSNSTIKHCKGPSRSVSIDVDLIPLYSVITEMRLDPALERLVLHWGDMGERWGINRTEAQVFALLFFGGRPLNAEDLVEILGVARSHISNSLRNLQNWGVISVVHKIGDRRDHFETLKDIWEVFEILLDERKRREVDPTIKALRETAALADQASPSETRARIREVLEFYETVDGWYSEIRRLPRASRVGIIKLGGKLSSLLAR